MRTTENTEYTESEEELEWGSFPFSKLFFRVFRVFRGPHF